MKVRIQSALMGKASRRRRQEWDRALEDLNHPPPPGEGILTLYREEEGAAFALSGQGDTRFIHLSQGELALHIKEYDDSIRRLIASSRGDGMRSIETLDYAKKLTHDQAGEFVQEALEEQGGLELDLPTCRRLFTLIFLVVTELPEALVTQHRIHL